MWTQMGDRPKSSSSVVTVDHSMAEVNHISLLLDNLSSLYLSETLSDVTLVVNDQRLPAHRVLLAARSDYFRALLYGGLKESQQNEIPLKVSSIDAFKCLLKYLYCGHFELKQLREETILEMFSLCHEYGITLLEDTISEYLKERLSIENVCLIFEISNLFQLKPLIEVCRTFIDRQALEVIKSDSFFGLSANTLRGVINKDSFCAQEIDIFQSVCEWIRRNQKESQKVVKDIMSCIRLPLISTNDLLGFVRNSGFVDSETLLDAIQTKMASNESDLNHRGFLLPQQNIASNGQVLFGTDLSYGDPQNYDSVKGFIRHNIDDPSDEGIVIKLEKQYIINHIRVLLWDRDDRVYSYYIELSMDQKNWHRVIDHRHYPCRSWQVLHFPSRVVQFIRLVGTHNSVNRCFHVVSIECFFTSEQFEVDRGLLVPSYNVSHIQNNGLVIEGGNRMSNGLIDGDFKNYDLNSGYTWHKLGAGAIVIQLSQPFMIDSMRLLLWDLDDRSYGYYVEVSVDEQDWHIVADRRKELCKSWQVLNFTRRPVVFVRIVGTSNSANETFHCIHFECPAQIYVAQGGHSNGLPDNEDEENKSNDMELDVENASKETNQMNE